MANFRVAVMPATPQFQGPNAADAVKAAFQQLAGRFNKNAHITVQTVSACNGTQKAYRVDDPLGMGSAGFMEIVPGSDSSGLINYEIMPGGKRDPAILDAVEKICWP